VAPWLFGLYTVVALLCQSLPEGKRSGGVAWPGKAVTFSDALAAVRRWRWAVAVFPQAGAEGAIENLPQPLRERLLTGPCAGPVSSRCTGISRVQAIL
jgi:hypothetical protein